MESTRTDAIILHAFDYRETSRIVRLATRDLGVVSVVARGARKNAAKFGQGMDLFTSGVAHIARQPLRDLHTLHAFDQTVVRPGLATTVDRFLAASALAEVALRFVREDEADHLFQLITRTLDTLIDAPRDHTARVALEGIWRIVAALGFAPALVVCAACHRSLLDADVVAFHHRAGGALCATCALRLPGGRVLPAAARATLQEMLSGGDRAGGDETPAIGAHADAAATSAVGAPAVIDGPSTLEPRAIRSHQRLLREFLEEHVVDGRPLRAFHSWEHSDRAATLPAPRELIAP